LSIGVDDLPPIGELSDGDMLQKLFLEVATALIVLGVTYYASRYFNTPHEQPQSSRARDGVPVRPNRNCPECLTSICAPMEMLPCDHLMHSNCLRKCLRGLGVPDCDEQVVDYFECGICGNQLSKEQIHIYASRV